MSYLGEAHRRLGNLDVALELLTECQQLQAELYGAGSDEPLKTASRLELVLAEKRGERTATGDDSRAVVVSPSPSPAKPLYNSDVISSPPNPTSGSQDASAKSVTAASVPLEGKRPANVIFVKKASNDGGVYLHPRQLVRKTVSIPV